MRQIKLARVVVLPSFFDEFSRALVETLSLGRPVITTTHVGTAPLVKEHECGLVVAPHDPEALAKAIDAALSPTAEYLDNAKRIGHRLPPTNSLSKRRLPGSLSGISLKWRSA